MSRTVSLVQPALLLRVECSITVKQQPSFFGVALAFLVGKEYYHYLVCLKIPRILNMNALTPFFDIVLRE